MMNKDIKLCGLGNAIVDFQFEVSDEEINELSLEKGTMTLVVDESQEKILKKMGNRTQYKSSGGSAANTVIAFSSFGGKAAYKSMIGEDNDGSFYSSEFNDLGIILDAKVDDNDHTGRCLVLISPDSERTMLTSLGATQNYNKDFISDKLIKRSEWLYIEGYKLTEDIGYEAALHACNVARKYDTKIALTISDKFIIDLFRDRLEKIAEFADLIFCNEVEGKLFTEAIDSADALDKLSNKYKNIAFTKGANGSHILWEGRLYEIPPYEATPIDSTGAGDMYAGGFFYGLIYGESIERAGNLGSLAASRVVSQHGARLKESHTDLAKEIFSKFK